VLGLDRPELNESRLTRRKILKGLIEARDLLVRGSLPPILGDIQQQIAAINQILEDTSQDSAEYSAMARACLA
jgi:hypothetical protein